MHKDRIANLLGAAALAVADKLVTVAEHAADSSASGSAALVTLAVEPGIGVTELGHRIRLTQSATWRMVDALAAKGLVVRVQARPGRSVTLDLTEKGRTAAREVLRTRGAELGALVGHLSDAERVALESALAKLLDRVFDDVRSDYVICRLCDRAACTAQGAICPVGRASRERGRDG